MKKKGRDRVIRYANQNHRSNYRVLEALQVLRNKHSDYLDALEAYNLCVRDCHVVVHTYRIDIKNK